MASTLLHHLVNPLAPLFNFILGCITLFLLLDNQLLNFVVY
jgi:hypothetical protein